MNLNLAKDWQIIIGQNHEAGDVRIHVSQPIYFKRESAVFGFPFVFSGQRMGKN
jgi:hypothetical protein